MVTLLGIHSIVYTYFVATGKWAKEVVEVYQLPDWISTQAKKNKRRAFRFIMGSMTAIAMAAWLGAAADTRGSGYAHLAPGFCGVRTGLQYWLVRRGIRRDRRARPAAAELKERADRLREERYGPTGGATPASRHSEPRPRDRLAVPLS